MTIQSIVERLKYSMLNVFRFETLLLKNEIYPILLQIQGFKIILTN